MLPKVNNQKVVGDIIDFLRKEFKERKKTCAVLGVSCGVDSTVCAFLCKKAGLDFYAVFMPCGDTYKKGKIRKLIQALNLPAARFIEINITEIVNEQVKALKTFGLDKIDKGNLMARTRMLILYALARKLNGLVLGTENLSEYWLGYFTLYGDQVSDINPLGGLWKSRVEELAEYLKIPPEILNQKPSAELWKGQTDEKELGFNYEEADPILGLFCVKKCSKRKIIEKYGFRSDLVERVLKRVEETEYKRQPIPVFHLNIQTYKH